MKILKLIIDFIKVSICMSLPFLALSLVEYLLRNVPSETIVQGFLALSILSALYIKIKFLKGGE
jgi:hypothetical protein